MLGPAAERLRAHVTDTGRFLRNRLKAGATLLAEGAHGAMLDLSAGTYPFVTSSHCTSAAVASGLEIAPRSLEASMLVLKAYTTRVGLGPFPHRAPRGDRRIPPQARQRVRHVDRPAPPHRLVRRRRRAHGRRALGRGGRRHHQARLPRRARRDSDLPRLQARRQAGLGPAAARRGHRPARARVREAAGLEVDDHRRHPLRGASRRRSAIRPRPRGRDRRTRRLRLDRPAPRRDDLAPGYAVPQRPAAREVNSSSRWAVSSVG